MLPGLEGDLVLHPAPVDGIGGGLRTRVTPKLAEDVRDMHFNGPLTHHQGCRNLFVALSGS